MDLNERADRMRRIAARCGGRHPGELLCVHPIAPAVFERLRYTAAGYMSRCLPAAPVITDEAILLSRFRESVDELKNLTPNGVIVPKRETILEYNVFARAVVDVIARLGIDDLAGSWRVPLNLRWKGPRASESQVRRPYATERLHTDAWAGEHPDGITMLIPVFGDAEATRVEFFTPPPDFHASWLHPLESYARGEELARRYRRLEVPFQLGHAYLFDMAMFHQTVRRGNGGPRVSVDTVLLPPAGVAPAGDANHPKPSVEHADLLGLGEEWLFVFGGSLREWREDAAPASQPPRPSFTIARL